MYRSVSPSTIKLCTVEEKEENNLNLNVVWRELYTKIVANMSVDWMYFFGMEYKVERIQFIIIIICLFIINKDVMGLRRTES